MLYIKIELNIDKTMLHVYIEIEFNVNIDKTMLHVIHRNWHVNVRVHRFLLHGRAFFDESVFDEIG